MKCHQCERPALYDMGGIHLCLRCSEILTRMQHQEFLINAAAANQALDDMEMVSGVSLGGGRMPLAAIARALQGSTTLNNFHLSNSQVGVLNTGTIEKIDAAITLTRGSDLQDIGELVRNLTQAIIETGELAANDRARMLDLIEELSQHIVRSRKPAVMSALMQPIMDGLKSATAVLPLAQKLWEAIQGLGS